MELFNIEELMKYIDIPILSLLIYAFMQTIKNFYDISKKWMPVMCFVVGMIASILILGSTGQLVINNSISFFNVLKNMLIYGSGAIVVHSLLHKTLPFVGKKSDDLFSNMTGNNKKNEERED